MTLKERLEELSRTRAGHLEMYTAAFISRVGTEEADRYVLVEEVRREADGGLTTTWTFRPKAEVFRD